MVQIRDEALYPWIIPPVCDDRFDLGQRAQTADVALDRAAIGLRRMNFAVKLIDRRMLAMLRRERLVQILTWKLRPQEREQRLRLRYQLFPGHHSGCVRIVDCIAPRLIVHSSRELLGKGEVASVGCNRLDFVLQSTAVEIQRALSDLEEVRERLLRVQRFEGYSAPAAVASGLVAILAGFVQLQMVPFPTTPAALGRYVLIWITCLAVALALNYGAVAIWVLGNRGPGARSRFRSAARSIAPAVLLGGLLTIALIDRSDYALLPGTWFALYSIGLFASRDAIPPATLPITIGFGILAALFLVSPLRNVALAWWVMPLGFGLGQIAIGSLIWRERSR